MPDIPRLTGPRGMEAFGAIVNAGRPILQALMPTASTLLSLIKHQVENFTQSHLASHANHFAGAHGFNDPSHQMDLGQTLQGFSQQLAHSMQGGNHGTHGMGNGSSFSDMIQNNAMQAHQTVDNIREQEKLNEMVDAAKMEAKKAKESRDWILQNL